MRRRGDTNPTRVYSGRIPEHLSAGAVPACFRQRWACQERVIRQMVNGANLNANKVRLCSGQIRMRAI